MKELERCVKELGFVAVATSAHSAGRNQDHPDFYPFYAKAQELGVPVCVHVGSGRPAAAADRFDNAFFVHATTHAFEQMIGVMCIVGGGILELYPKLKVAFLEVSAQWLPYVLADIAKRYHLQGRELNKKELLRESRFYVGCEISDDLPYIVEHAGDDNLVVGTDYGHADSATELLALRGLLEDKRLGAPVANKIVSENARALYGL